MESRLLMSLSQVPMHGQKLTDFAIQKTPNSSIAANQQTSAA